MTTHETKSFLLTRVRQQAVADGITFTAQENDWLEFESVEIPPFIPAPQSDLESFESKVIELVRKVYSAERSSNSSIGVLYRSAIHSYQDRKAYIGHLAEKALKDELPIDFFSILSEYGLTFVGQLFRILGVIFALLVLLTFVWIYISKS